MSIIYIMLGDHVIYALVRLSGKRQNLGSLMTTICQMLILRKTSLNLTSLILYERHHEKTCLLWGFPTRSDTNWAIQPLKMATGLKFRIKEVEGLYYLCSEIKEADKLRVYSTATLRLFLHMEKASFPMYEGMPII